MSKEERDKQEVITYDSIVAGALLKMEEIDNIDFSLLVENFEKETKQKVTKLWDDLYLDLGNYIKKLQNGIIKLKDGVTLDDYIETEHRTLREKLQEVAGNEINKYFENFNLDAYQQEKKKILLDNKKKVLSSANVLLISDIPEEYEEIIKYGFKNVDYFKSIIRADKYFAEHREELEKYHIILKGNQMVQKYCFYGDMELNKAIRNLRDISHILEVDLHRSNYSDHLEIMTCLYDDNNHRSWHPVTQNYTDIFDKIVENALINHTLEKIKRKDFVPVKDNATSDKLPIPATKSDLKILYLDTLTVSRYAAEISRELGLNITFKEDNNYSFDKYIKRHLGDYDIIIASNLYSGNLLAMSTESTEQCKDTGRNITLLTTYKVIPAIDSKLGSHIFLQYVYGGSLTPSTKYNNKEFNVLRQSIPVEETEEYWKESCQSEYSNMKAIIEASVSIYNQTLIEENKPAISNLDFKSGEALNEEYRKAYEQKLAQQEAELAPIKSFDSIREIITSYLKYKKQGIVIDKPAGLKITEGKDGIKVDNIYQGKIFCSVAFPKEYRQEELRVFSMQTLSKKGTLSSPQTVGLYTSKYENLDSTPTRPNEKQFNALISIEKKVNVALKPLNEEAQNKNLKLNSPKKLVLNKKSKKTDITTDNK